MRYSLQLHARRALSDSQAAGGLCCGDHDAGGLSGPDTPSDPWTPWGAAGDLVARMFGDDNYYLHRAVDRGAYEVNQAECTFFENIWGSACYLGLDQAEHILNCYIALAKDGRIAEFHPRTATSGFGWGPGGVSLGRLAECALVSREQCYKMMLAVYHLSMNGYIPDYRVLWPVTALAQQKEREETPEGFKKNLPGTSFEMDTVLSVLKWLLILGAAGVGVYALSSVVGGIGSIGGRNVK